MDTTQIEYFLKDLRGFKGVYASNRIPKIFLTKNPQGFIVNLDPHYLPGSHWVAIIIFKSGKYKRLQFFDSYGLKPPLKEVSKEWFVQHNPWQFQSSKSTVCGQYCIFFIRKRLQGMSFKSILEELRKKDKPDIFVKKFVQNLKKCKYPLCNFPPAICQNCKPFSKKRLCCVKPWNLKKWQMAKKRRVKKP